VIISPVSISLHINVSLFFVKVQPCLPELQKACLLLVELDARQAMCQESKKHSDSIKTLADFLDKVEHDLAAPQIENRKKELERAQVLINLMLSDLNIEVNIYNLICMNIVTVF